jgi:hypothetical protein
LAKQKAIGLGFIPSETKHHFLIYIPRSKQGEVIVYERFTWDSDDNQKPLNLPDEQIKVRITRSKWDLVKNVIEKEFNRRLQKNDTIVGRFKSGYLPIERLLGKELVLLLWAIEDSDPSLIKIALTNWLGLSPEERWWLFTMANASTGYYANKRGWRIAIRYALTDNPIDDKIKQLTIFDRINSE